MVWWRCILATVIAAEHGQFAHIEPPALPFRLLDGILHQLFLLNSIAVEFYPQIKAKIVELLNLLGFWLQTQPFSRLNAIGICKRATAVKS